jgi:uncharacterized protein YchJ
MSFERALEREHNGNGRWTSASPLPVIHGAERWLEGDHDALREYVAAHEWLPAQPQALPEEEVGALAAQLHEPHAREDERKRILIFLAHHGSARATSELQRFVECSGARLRRFAELAFREALEAAAPAARCLGRNEPCPCGGGRKFKDCCARRLT